MHTRFSIVAGAFALAFSIAATPPAITFNAFAVSANGQLQRVNTTSGLSALVGNIGLSGCESLAQDAQGVIWTAVGGGASTSTGFFTVDPVTAAATLAFTAALNGTVRGMAFDDDAGDMLVVVDLATASTDSLVRIDDVTHAPTTVGSLGVSAIHGLALAPWGDLYAWNATTSVSGLGLMRVNLSSGVAIDVNTSVPGSTNVAALAIGADGSIVGAGSALFDIDPTTGVRMQIGVAGSSSWTGLVVTGAMTAHNAGMMIESDGDVWRVNADSGARRAIGNCGHSPIVALTKRATVRQMLAAVDLGTQTELVRVELSNAASTSLGVANIARIKALDERSGGVLFAIVDGLGTNNDELHTINLSGLVTSILNTVGSSTIEGLTTGPFFDSIGWDSVRGLVLTPFGANVVDLDPSVGAPAVLTSIAFDERWRLFGVGDALYRIDLDGAQVTQVGLSGLTDVVGVEFVLETFNGLPATYCTSQTNSVGCTPSIQAVGPFTASTSTASRFSITATNVVAQKLGLLFYGVNGRNNSSFLGGTLCVQPPLRRTALQNSGGASGCLGVFSFDFNAHLASGVDPALVAGVVVDAQYWSRDPAAALTTNLTNAIEFTVFP